MAEAQWHPKREARQFEPPPWEREQFEALNDRREEEAPAKPEQPAAAAEVVELPPVEEEALLTTEVEISHSESVLRVGAEPGTTARKLDELPPGVSQMEIDSMLARLGAEEPRVDEHYRYVGLFGSVVAMLLGVSMVGWGLYAMMTARGHLAGVIGALIVLAMGFVFGLTGLWVGWRATNEQGEK